MAKQELVTVQHVKNKQITRQMTVASAKLNSRLWKVVGEPVVAEVKKKDAAPAVAKLSKHVESSNSFVNEANDDLGNAGQFAKITDEQSEKSTLQAKYETLSGKKPDGRWNEAKLREKIAELKPNDDEAA